MGGYDGLTAPARHLSDSTRRIQRAAQILGLQRRSTFADGPPPALTFAQLAEWSDQLLPSPLASVRHLHTSGWKSSGAYRVLLTATDDSRREVFCKVNDHRPEEISALSDFPATVGPPEIAVLEAGRHVVLQRHLPQLYASARLGETRSILCMEALSSRWQPCTSWARDLATAARAAGAIQRQLHEWWQRSPDPALINYDQQFSAALNAYAHAKLHRFATETGDELARSAVARWTQLSRAYLPAAGRGGAPTVVHGDFNTANVFLHLSRRRVKVIDWEWAGVGDGYRDLAGLLKRAPRAAERRAILAYHDVVGGRPDWRGYERSQVERGLLDASYLAAQLMQSRHPQRMDMTGFIRTSLRRVFSAVDALAA